MKQDVVDVRADARRPRHQRHRRAAAAAQEGILLPPPRPTNDAAGRIFLIFVDDLHMDFRDTGRIRELFKKIAKELIHDGDMFGIVSTGPSSIAIDMTYDRKRLDEAINKISGNGLKPYEIIETPDGSQGPPEVRYRAHVAFSTAYDILKNLEQVHNRRKAFIYVSNGYDFDPFSKSRAKATPNAAHDLRQRRARAPTRSSCSSAPATTAAVVVRHQPVRHVAAATSSRPPISRRNSPS